MRYFMLNKPAGCVCACTDPSKKTVLDLFPEDIAHGLHPVGRLDFDTRGLLLLTDDGMVDQALLLPERHCEKKYFIRAVGEMTPEKIRSVESGLLIGESDKLTRPARFTLLEKTTVGDIADFIPENRRKRYLKNASGPAFSAELEICEGRKHQVKLMLRAVNCRVVYLKRTEIAGIKLDERLAEGEYRELTRDELSVICELENRIRRERITVDGMLGEKDV